VTDYPKRLKAAKDIRKGDVFFKDNKKYVAIDDAVWDELGHWQVPATGEDGEPANWSCEDEDTFGVP